MAALPLSSPDLTDCDREPIHIPGAIQPHGLLLVADEDGSVIAGAGALEQRLSAGWLGASLDDLLGQELPSLAGRETTDSDIIAMLPVQGIDARFTVTLHRSGNRLLVELIPEPVDAPTASATLAWLDNIATNFERASDLQGLCERAAVAFRTLTGFDRVMIYRFLDDEAGRVMAEDRAPDLGTFLHHHFPATDIPVQARALYIRNRTRVIPDIGYTPAPIRPAGFETLDLSDVALRSVSPIHLRYLANMGVTASASISIVKDGLLWGLIACHHNSPRDLSPGVRAAAAVLASGLARQIRAKEEAEAYRERLRLRAVQDSVTPRLNDEEPLVRAIAATKADLLTMLDGDGFALVDGRTIETEGRCPDDLFMIDVARWARARGGEPFSTHELGTVFPEATAQRKLASGLLALPLIDDQAVLLWFRAERVEEIEWAGNPHKAVAPTGGTLSPRTSFDSWIETVRGRSRRWSLEELEAAHRLRRAFHDAYQHQNVRRLNRDFEKAIAAKDALLVQKDILMKEVNHRVQNSLQLVAAFLRLQAKSAGPGEVNDHLAEAQARLAAVALVHRRLYRDDQVESIDLSRYLDELVADMRASLGAEWGAAMRLDLAPVLVPTDRAIDIGLILTELVINATKYAYDGRAGPIRIALEQHRNRFRLIVADEGRGKGSGEGFGSRMMAAMVQRLDGTIDYDDNRPGLRAILTAPIGEVS